MVVYHTKTFTDSDGLVYRDIDPEIKPFVITTDSLKSAKYTINCPFGYRSPWEPQKVSTRVVCHCTSTYSPHEFVVRAV